MYSLIIFSSFYCFTVYFFFFSLKKLANISLKETILSFYILLILLYLLKLNIPNHANFLNLIFEKGFLPSICKATRCQNESKTLIDQILLNKNCENLYSGTIVSDTSDHFITFIAPPGRCKYSHTNNAAIQSRDYSMFQSGACYQKLGYSL